MNKAKRKAVIAGNWKMNKTAGEAATLIAELIPEVSGADCDVVICVPYTDLPIAVSKTAGIKPRRSTLLTTVPSHGRQIIRAFEGFRFE